VGGNEKMSDMPTMERELARLQAENAALKAEQGQNMVRIVLPENHAVMPSVTEMRELFDAVLGRWPNDFRGVEPDMFARAFRSLAMVYRQDALDTSVYSHRWVQLVNSRLRNNGGDVSLKAFIAASLAWGDVSMTRWDLQDEGHLLSFALNEFCGRLPTDQWRQTLAGNFAKPIDPRPKKRIGTVHAPRPRIYIDGREMPDEQRFVGGSPLYGVDF
jgi:hypothetical protein